MEDSKASEWWSLDLNPAGRSIPELKTSTTLFRLLRIRSEPDVSEIVVAVPVRASAQKIFKFENRMELEEKLRPQGGKGSSQEVAPDLWSLQPVSKPPPQERSSAD